MLAARDPAEYVAMLDEAIHRGRHESYRRLLDEEARNNTWEARGRQIIAQLDALGRPRRKRRYQSRPKVEECSSMDPTATRAKAPVH